LARGEQQTLRMGSEEVTVHVRRAERVLLSRRDCDPSAALDFVASYITVSTR
jgi:hypothetical protein